MRSCLAESIFVFFFYCGKKNNWCIQVESNGIENEQDFGSILCFFFVLILKGLCRVCNSGSFSLFLCVRPPVPISMNPWLNQQWLNQPNKNYEQVSDSVFTVLRIFFRYSLIFLVQSRISDQPYNSTRSYFGCYTDLTLHQKYKNTYFGQSRNIYN